MPRKPTYGPESRVRYNNKIVVQRDGKVLVVTTTFPNGSSSTERMPIASVSGGARAR